MKEIPDKYNGKVLRYKWIYLTPDRKKIGYVGRYENDGGDKDVIPFFNFKTGKWLPGIDLNPTPLYGLARLTKLSDEEFVFIVEGEKCALALSRLGFCAVTSVGGANAAKKADWSVLKRFRQVIIIPDNDEAGERYARDVYYKLKQISSEIDLRIVRFSNLPKGGDIIDFIKGQIPDWDGYSKIEEADRLEMRLAKLFKKAKPAPDEWTSGLNQKFEWKEPTQLGSSALLPVLPIKKDMIPEQLREWLSDIGYRMQTPKDIIAVSAIVVFGSLIGCGCSVRPKQHDDWEVVPNLWGACVARPSIMLKSPSMNQVIHLVDRLQANYCQLHQENKAVENVEKSKIDARICEIEKEILALPEKEDCSEDVEKKLKAELIALKKQLESTSELRLFVTNETSVQSLVKLHVSNTRGNLVHKDELPGLLAFWLRKDGASERAFYLAGWNGNGSYSDSKIGRGLTMAESICISLLGGIQPDRLQDYLKQMHEGGNDGMLQRFQLMVYPDPIEWQLIDQKPNREAKERVFKIMEKIAEMDFTEYGAKLEDFDKRPYFRFSLRAQEIANDWFINLQTVKIAQEQNPIVQEHLSKYRSLMPSLALIFHVISVADDGESHCKIPSNCVRQAIKWCEYLESHARRIYALNDSQMRTGALNLAEKIRSGKVLNPFTAKNIYDKHWSELNKREEVEAACNILIDENWLMIGEISKPSMGRPSLPEYYINPALL